MIRWTRKELDDVTRVLIGLALCLLVAAFAAACEPELIGPEVGEPSYCQRTTSEVIVYNVPGKDGNSYAFEVATCGYRIGRRKAPLAADHPFMVTKTELEAAAWRLQ